MTDFEKRLMALGRTSTQRCAIIIRHIILNGIIQTPCIMRVDAEWSIYHGKIVQVKAPFMFTDGRLHYDCQCVDGSGGGLIPENILKPIEE